MKTAVLCWGLFSIAFAFPIAQPPHAGPLKTLEIEQEGSHLVSIDAKAQGGTLSAEVKDEEPAKPEPFSSDGNDDKAQKEGSHFVSSDTKAQVGTLSSEVKDEEPTKPDSFSSDENDDKALKDAVVVPVQHVEAQEAAPSVWISADHPEYSQLERQAFATLNSHLLDSRESNDDEEDLISPTASDDSNLQEISYALDDGANAFEPVNEQAFDDGYAGNDPEEHQCKVGAEAEFAGESLENVLASVDTENEPSTPVA